MTGKKHVPAVMRESFASVYASSLYVDTLNQSARQFSSYGRRT